MKLKAAVIGTGRIGYLLQKDKKREQPASHSAALAQNRRIALIAGCDLNPKRLFLWKRDYPQAACYTSASELMQREKPDLVAVAVSEEAHLEVALTVIRHRPGLIILEKPVAPNLRQAERIRKEAGRYQVPISINHERRFSRDYQLVKDLLQKEKLGKLQTVYAYLCNGSRIWSPACYEDGNCSLIHDGTHLVDILHFLLEEKLKNPTMDRIVKTQKGEVRVLNLHYHLSNDTLLCLEFNGQSKVFDFGLVLNGSRGRIIIGNGYLKFYSPAPSPFYAGFFSFTRRKNLKRPQITGYFSRMIDNCVDFLKGKAPLISPLSEGIKGLEVLDEIVTCLDQKK
jgi:predicted dehydrogenase